MYSFIMGGKKVLMDNLDYAKFHFLAQKIHALYVFCSW